jgi:hypothetical protein
MKLNWILKAMATLNVPVMQKDHKNLLRNIFGIVD